MNRILASMLLMVFFALSCGDKEQNKQKTEKKTEDTPNEKPKIDESLIRGLVEAIPNPIEISTLVKELGVDYDKSFTNSISKIPNYNTDFERALNLGIFSADLGYANIYNQTQDAINFLTGVKKMADGLKIGKFINIESLRDIVSNKDNLDELIEVTGDNLQEINSYLQEEGRSDKTVLIITGGWIEGLYLLASVAEKSNNIALDEKIAEQKITLEQIVLLVDHFHNDSKKMDELLHDLKSLQNIYKKIEIRYVKGESKTEVIDGVLTVVQEEHPEINITLMDIKNILNKIKEIRTKITN